MRAETARSRTSFRPAAQLTSTPTEHRPATRDWHRGARRRRILIGPYSYSASIAIVASTHTTALTVTHTHTHKTGYRSRRPLKLYMPSVCVLCVCVPWHDRGWARPRYFALTSETCCLQGSEKRDGSTGTRGSLLELAARPSSWPLRAAHVRAALRARSAAC